LKRNRTEYYERLQRVRTTGDWEQWLTFFLKGVIETADEATSTARKILQLRESLLTRLQQAGKSSGNLLRTLDLLFQRPVLSARAVERELKLNYVTANSILSRLMELQIVTESTG